MSGSAGDRASTDEASDSLQPDVRHPDTFATVTPESASESREKMAGSFQPGMHYLFGIGYGA
ncbi:hypothetical protein PENDEC_c006G01978 [Penicillium decumbens]|uniref:Uncharacterized protein n=1 Tax=Penicillium decumbens TaxID=69771 RepID=A0A1V6PFR0_PENDC|nr:hypothetical protein PENDEC_c006G01978 [Penicillium decumbens]